MVDQLRGAWPPSDLGSGDRQRVRRSPTTTLVAVVLIALVAGGVGVGWLVAGAGEPTEIPEAMSDTLDEWMAAVLAQDTGRIVALYSADAVWHDEALDETYSGASKGWSIFGFVEEVTEVGREAVSGNTAVMRWTLDGIDWSTTGLSVLTFDGGVIVAETVYYDCAQSPVASRCANVR